MSAQPIQHHSPPGTPRTIREFRAVLKGADLTLFNTEVDDVPLHEIREYLKGWQHLLHLRAVPEVGEALRTAFDRPGIPASELFPEWVETGV
ncbi:hypothetical protein [Kitasatospora sp. MAP5-34]|uniref:hypothetical protein n=1 Tax=Kitasatospora sp. MAP5-34 TaxID=3035102 RepID=UPI002476CCEA|nr:hypothetical protein [Kitasatospora sp. MAP5-34]MDH6578006.1 hypothetical protein [Kitasatospora sp. MAP5-34]